MNSETEIYITAKQAYPAFERVVLAAKAEILISMRVFDPSTKLRSDEASKIGETWSDLIAHKLAQGVKIDLTIADFDPIARPAMHRYSNACLEAAKLAADDAGAPENLTARTHLHPVRVGWLQRLIFFPMARGKIASECARLNALSDQEREQDLVLSPALRPFLVGSGNRLRPRFWPPVPLVPATHHQKIAVIDGEYVYVGGLDLNERRYDNLDHERASNQTWHDVQVMQRGEVARAARAHLLEFRDVTAGAVRPSPFGGLLRTMSRPKRGIIPRLSPQTEVKELEEAHVRLIREARDFIYIETQFLRSSVITQALVEAGKRHRDLQLIMILPSEPSDLAFDQSHALDLRYGEQLQSDSIGEVTEAFGHRVFFGSPTQDRRSKDPSGDDSLEGAPIIYVHAKVLVVDRKAAIVSSANLNGRSMRWDTECGVELNEADSARMFDKSLAHWFPEDAPKDPTRAADWRATSEHAADRVPDQRRHYIMPHDNTRAEELGQPLPGVPEEMV